MDLFHSCLAYTLTAAHYMHEKAYLSRFAGSCGAALEASGASAAVLSAGASPLGAASSSLLDAFLALLARFFAFLFATLLCRPSAPSTALLRLFIMSRIRPAASSASKPSTCFCCRWPFAPLRCGGTYPAAFGAAVRLTPCFFPSAIACSRSGDCPRSG
jgi:hypothetical protein